MEKLFKINKKNVFFISCASLLLVSLNPYFVWGWMPIAFSAAIIISFLLSFLVIDVYDGNKLIKSYFVFLIVIVYSLLNAASLAGSLALAISITLIVSLKGEYICIVFNYFKKLFALALVPGLILWVIHHVFGFDHFYIGSMPEGYIPNKGKVAAGIGYAIYPFAIVTDYMLNYPIYRFTGVLDEPGFIGTVCALMIASNRLKIKTKADFIILFSGVVSFSLAFYLILAIYYAFLSIKSFKKFAGFILAALVLVFFSSYNETVKKYTVDRLVIVDGKVSGDNRQTEELEGSFERWMDSDGYDFFFGLTDYTIGGSSSWKEIPLKTGFFGVVLLLLLFILIYYSLSNKLNLHFTFFAFVFLLSVYQRPYIVAPAFIVIFLFAVINSKSDYKGFIK